MISLSISISQVWNTAYPILIAILFFELIIIVHEGGHFAAAKLNKIQVNEFSIGMGPKIFSKTFRGTKYSLRWILFGGYCAMEGEDEDSDNKNAFSSKKVWQRIVVVVAGAVMNLLLGFIIMIIIVSTSNLVGTCTVAKFDDNAVSQTYGLQVGDTIKSIDGMRVFTTSDISTAFSRSDDGIVDMTVQRDGKTVQLDDVHFATQEQNGHNYISMDFWLLGKEKNVGNVLEASCLEFLSYGRMVFLSVYDLLGGKYGLSDLSGPVGSVSIISDAVKTSVPTMLRIMALLTINVGLFNLFPIPALDGWRIFLLIFEGITRKKLPAKFEWLVNTVGLVALLGLMCVVTFSDITKLF